MKLEDLPEFYRDVLDAILADDSDRAILQSQIERSEISIELTGVGFYVRFKVDPECPRIEPPNRHPFGDVMADVAGLELGCGFVMFVKDGFVSQLEGFSFEEPWPETITDYKLKPVPVQG